MNYTKILRNSVIVGFTGIFGFDFVVGKNKRDRFLANSNSVLLYNAIPNRYKNKEVYATYIEKTDDANLHSVPEKYITFEMAEKWFNANINNENDYKICNIPVNKRTIEMNKKAKDKFGICSNFIDENYISDKEYYNYFTEGIESKYIINKIPSVRITKQMVDEYYSKYGNDIKYIIQMIPEKYINDEMYDKYVKFLLEDVKAEYIDYWRLPNNKWTNDLALHFFEKYYKCTYCHTWDGGLKFIGTCVFDIIPIRFISSLMINSFYHYHIHNEKTNKTELAYQMKYFNDDCNNKKIKNTLDFWINEYNKF